MTGERRILVVDDERDICGLLKLVLETEGYVTELAADGFGALRAVESRPPDCLLLDVMMPGLDGHLVLRTLRSRRPTLPVVMMTAALGDEHVWRAWSEGVDYFLTKPFDPDDLLRFLAGLFARPAAAGG
ncbi:MAG TPA: response regulator [Frankiaceae bacterium]|nr:response regulator [Frankiaceae bacterium]